MGKPSYYAACLCAASVRSRIIRSWQLGQAHSGIETLVTEQTPEYSETICAAPLRVRCRSCRIFGRRCLKRSSHPDRSCLPEI